MPSFLKHPRPLGLWRSLAGQGIWPPTVSTVGSARYRFYTVDTAATRERSSRKMFMYLLTLAGAMVGASYAAVPLYRRFCQATGYGGTVQRRESVEEKIVRHARDGTKVSRELVVQFNADVADGMPWKFVPTQRQVKVKPGESALAFYTAENRSSVPITGVSTYNVTPMKAAIYFNKIQCFCFEEQTLLPGEQIDMPVSSVSYALFDGAYGHDVGYSECDCGAMSIWRWCLQRARSCVEFTPALFSACFGLRLECHICGWGRSWCERFPGCPKKLCQTNL